MNETDALELMRATIWTTLIVSLPALVASIVVGLVVAFLQAITTLQDQTLSAVPKACAVGVAVAVTAPFALDVLVRFTVAAFSVLGSFGQ